MEEPYDLMGSVLSTKANELMIGFAGFTQADEPGSIVLEGMVKVSAFHRADGSGYLTLTFIIDQEPGPARQRLGKADPEALRQLLGPNFEMLIDIPLSEFSSAMPFYVEEMDAYFRRLQGQEKAVADTQLLPALGQLLKLKFEPLHDWRLAPGQPPPGRLTPAAAPAGRPDEPRARTLLQRLLGKD